MSNLNLVVLQGNLTRDVETRFSGAGLAIVSFGLAVNDDFTTKDGEKRKGVVFVDCTAFGKQGEALAKFFNKGKQIIITGRLRLDTWDDKITGQKRSKLGVIVESFSFSGSKPADAPTSNSEAATEEPASATAAGDDGKLF